MPQKSDKTILVIDDDSGIRTAMEYMLQDAGYGVITSEDSSIIEKLTTQKVHLIIIDLLLSGNDGKAVVKKLKSQKSTNKIPVIILSAHPTADIEAKEAGADGFLPKPFNIEDLIGIIQKHVK